MRPWYVLYTAPRAEIKVAERLQNLGFDVYCPTRMEVRQWSDRKKKIIVPVLPSMVLIQIDSRSRNSVFDVPGAIRYLHWMGKIAEVSEEEVSILKKALEERTVIDHKISKMTPGVEITLSEFNGTKGIVQKSSGNKIWVALKEINCIVAIEVA